MKEFATLCFRESLSTRRALHAGIHASGINIQVKQEARKINKTLTSIPP